MKDGEYMGGGPEGRRRRIWASSGPVRRIDARFNGRVSGRSGTFLVDLRGIAPSEAMCWCRTVSSTISFNDIVKVNAGLWTSHQRRRLRVWLAVRMAKKLGKHGGEYTALETLNQYDSQQERESEGLMQ